MKALLLGGLVIVAVHVAPYLVSGAALIQVNSGGGQSQDRISDVDDVERKRLLDARLAIEQAARWSGEDAEACAHFYERPSEFAMCLQEETYTRILYTLRRGCLGSLVATCFEAGP